MTGKTTEYRFDPLDFLAEVYDNEKRLAEYRYTPGGQLQSLSHGPVRMAYSWDADQNLTALMAHSGSELLVDNHYSYDGNGNRTEKRQKEGETRYTYDGLNQLTKIEYPTLTEELFYDRSGNRTRRLSGGEEERYSYDPRNRLTSHTKGGVTTPLVYDDAGNLLRDGSAAYEYDAFNRTVKVDTFDGNVQVNRYDAEGLRYELEENGRLVQFIFRQQEVITEQSETETIRLIRGYDLIASDAQSARTYYHYASDELGSTTHIVDKDGAIQNQYAYDAFGNVTEQKEAVPNRFKYNGQQLDPITGQYYLRARFYNPVVARFTQEDVYRGDGLNLYTYCRNNPVVYVDPSGYNACSMDAQLAQQRAAGEQLSSSTPDDVPSRTAGSTGNPVLELSRSEFPGHTAMLDAAQAEGHSLLDLERGAGTRAAERNRYLSQKETRAAQGGPPDGFDYDEFPYASTVQGGTGAHVEPVLSADNQGAGRALGNFYRLQGIGPGDLFDIKIID